MGSLQEGRRMKVKTTFDVSDFTYEQLEKVYHGIVIPAMVMINPLFDLEIGFKVLAEKVFLMVTL